MSRVITVTGSTAVGKTSTFRELRLLLPEYQFTGGGEFMRPEADKRGMSIEEWSEYCKTHLEHDRACDAFLYQRSKANSTVIDTRVPHIFSHAYHVLQKCSIETCAQRRQKEPKYERFTVKQVEGLIMDRDLANFCRYQRLYPNQLFLDADYHLVLSTETAGPAEIAREIRDQHARWAERMLAENRLADSFQAL